MKLTHITCSSCSSIFAIPDDTEDAVCPQCGEAVPRLQEALPDESGKKKKAVPPPIPAAAQAKPRTTQAYQQSPPADKVLGRIPLSKKTLGEFRREDRTSRETALPPPMPQAGGAESATLAGFSPDLPTVQGMPMDMAFFDKDSGSQEAIKVSEPPENLAQLSENLAEARKEDPGWDEGSRVIPPLSQDLRDAPLTSTLMGTGSLEEQPRRAHPTKNFGSNQISPFDVPLDDLEEPSSPAGKHKIESNDVGPGNREGARQAAFNNGGIAVFIPLAPVREIRRDTGRVEPVEQDTSVKRRRQTGALPSVSAKRTDTTGLSPIERVQVARDRVSQSLETIKEQKKRFHPLVLGGAALLLLGVGGLAFWLLT